MYNGTQAADKVLDVRPGILSDRVSTINGLTAMLRDVVM